MIVKRKVIGLVENVYIRGKNRNGEVRGIKVKAKIDTGASRSSISKELAQKLRLGRHSRRTTIVKSALGRERRKLIKIEIRLKGKALKAFFSVADRKHMPHRVLIGKNVLRMGRFLVDPLK